MCVKFLITFFVATGCLSASCQRFPYRTETVNFTVFDKDIRIRTHTYGDPQLFFLSLHDNEDTGIKAAFEFMRLNGASITELNYGSVRNIGFSTDSAKYEIDPNRIFSPRGIHAFYTDEEPVYRISALADTVLDIYNYKNHGYIITLHNNADTAFSVRSYLQGAYLEQTAEAVFINPAMDEDDFIFVTVPFFFEYLKKQGVNVVLQSRTPPEDGSLSVYAAANNIPYINIEVQHRHVDVHYELINVVYGMMQEYHRRQLARLNTND